METFGGFLVFAGLLAFIFACITLVYPIKALGVPTRRRDLFRRVAAALAPQPP